jgi:hypothetical protein
VKGLTDLLTRYVDPRQAEFLNSLSEPERNDIERELRKIEEPAAQKEFLLWRMWQRAQAKDPGQLPSLELSSQELAELRKTVSPELRDRLERMSEDEQRKRVAELARFLLFSHYASQRTAPPPPAGSEDLTAYLEKLPREERDHLLNLPPEEMQRILWLKYWQSRLPPPGGGRPRGPRSEPGHRDRPPGPTPRGPSS